MTPPEKNKKKFWFTTRTGYSVFLLPFALATFVAVYAMGMASETSEPDSSLLTRAAVVAVGLTTVVAIIRTAFLWLLKPRNVRKALFGVACLATLIALFYAEEDWRGKREWTRGKRLLEANGFAVDMAKSTPTSVPDDQNIFKAPHMTEWFVTRSGPAGSNSLTGRLIEFETTHGGRFDNIITNEAVAGEYLAGSEFLTTDFDAIREALKRPYARMDGDYSSIRKMSVPNAATLHETARVLSHRAHCDLILGHPDQALPDVMLLHDLCRLTEVAPDGQPTPLIAAMIGAIINGLYVDAITDGFRQNAWQEPQLTALQAQLNSIRLLPLTVNAIHNLPLYALQPADVKLMISKSLYPKSLNDPTFLKIAPEGWIYLNIANCMKLFPLMGAGYDLDHDSISPHLSDAAMTQSEDALRRPSPFTVLASVTFPSPRRIMQVTGSNQNRIHQAQIACAIERFRLARGEFPQSLDALMPQFIQQIPHDVINDGLMIYRRTTDGYVLYSVGWNEKDDGGVTAHTKNGQPDMDNGDWVWTYPPK